MYKLSLNNLCQQRRWAAPAYTDQREVPDHAPTFHATVVVGGAKFCSPEEGGTAEVAAQNLAAMVALGHLSALPAPPPPGPETQVPYKSQLQEYAQKRHKDLPSYDTIRSGPLHPQMFKSTVTIDGRRFYSPRDYGTKKEAEFAAAAAALMSLNQEEKPLEKRLLAGSSPCISLPRNQANYKLQLQIYAQKRGKQLPFYRLIQEGPPHATLFKSIVTIDGQNFQSPQNCRTIKAAESAAANLALVSLPQDTSTQEQLPVQATQYASSDNTDHSSGASSKKQKINAGC